MSLVKTLKEKRDAVATEAENLLAADATEETLAAISEKQAEVDALDENIRSAEKLEARTSEIAESRKASGVTVHAAGSAAVVTREAMTYDRDGRNSYFKDLLAANIKNDRGAWDRLSRHADEVRVENRDISTSNSSGGDFVPPLYLVNDYAEFARAKRVAANLVTNEALPTGTDSIKIPAIKTGSLTAFQNGQNTTVANRDLVTSTVSGDVQTISGYEGVSIQLVEQSPLAGGLDRMIFGDLMADYNLQLNSAVLGNGDGTNYSIRGLLNVGADATNGVPVSWTETTPTVAGMYKAINQAVSAIATNRFDDAEAIIMTPAHWYWLAAQTDSAGRPLVVPGGNGAFNAIGKNDKPAGSAGLVGNIAGIPVYIDATLTKTYGTSTNQAPIIVGKFSDTYLFEGGVKTRVLPETKGDKLDVLFQVYGYVAQVNRFAKSIVAITGSGATAPSGF